MLDHLGIPVRDLDVSREFYRAAPAPLGYSLLMQPAEHVCGVGRDRKPDFWTYGALVLDPDDNDVEAVHHRPAWTTRQENR